MQWSKATQWVDHYAMFKFRRARFWRRHNIACVFSSKFTRKMDSAELLFFCTKKSWLILWQIAFFERKFTIYLLRSQFKPYSIRFIWNINYHHSVKSINCEDDNRQWYKNDRFGNKCSEFMIIRWIEVFDGAFMSLLNLEKVREFTSSSWYRTIAILHYTCLISTLKRDRQSFRLASRLFLLCLLIPKLWVTFSKPRPMWFGHCIVINSLSRLASLLKPSSPKTCALTKFI